MKLIFDWLKRQYVLICNYLTGVLGKIKSDKKINDLKDQMEKLGGDGIETVREKSKGINKRVGEYAQAIHLKDRCTNALSWLKKMCCLVIGYLKRGAALLLVCGNWILEKIHYRAHKAEVLNWLGDQKTILSKDIKDDGPNIISWTLGSSWKWMLGNTWKAMAFISALWLVASVLNNWGSHNEPEGAIEIPFLFVYLSITTFLVCVYYANQWINVKVWNKSRALLVVALGILFVLSKPIGRLSFFWFLFLVGLIGVVLFLEFVLFLRCKPWETVSNFSYDGLEYSTQFDLTEHVGDDCWDANFVSSVADEIASSFHPSQSFATSVVGACGSERGAYIAKLKEAVSSLSNKPDLIIEYKPSFRSPNRSLVHDFFIFYKHHLAPSFPSLSSCIDLYYAYLTGDIPKDMLHKVSRVLKALGNNDFLTQELFETICKTLSKAQYRVLIAINNMDQLPPSEVEDLLRLIHCTASFPYTHFLIAYNKVDLCEQQKQISSELDDVFQLEIALPELKNSAMCDLLNDCMDQFEQKDQFDDWSLLKAAVGTRIEQGDYLIAQILPAKTHVIRFYNIFKLKLRACLLNKDSVHVVSVVDLFYCELMRYRFPKEYATCKYSARNLMENDDKSTIMVEGDHEISTPILRKLIELVKQI